MLEGFARTAFADLNDETVQYADGTVRVKTADQLRALESLGRHLALFNDKISHEFEGPIRDEQGTLRLQLGRITLVNPSTKAETKYPASSVVLFDEAGAVIERLPR